MKKQTNNRFLALVSGFCAILLFLTACGVQASPPATTTHASVPVETAVPGTAAAEETAGAPSVKTYSLPLENRSVTCGGLGGGVCSSTTADGYYVVAANILWFRDAQTGKQISLCAQSGCKHTDETCQAYIGNASYYVDYHGDLYAMVSDRRDEEDLGVRFVRKSLSDGSIVNIDTWTNTDDTFYRGAIQTIADNLALIHITTTHRIEDESGYRMESEGCAWLYDLMTGEKQKFLENAIISGSYSILAISANYAAVRYTGDESGMPTREEYMQQHENGHYDRYLRANGPHELRLYDLQTGEYTLVASTAKDALVFTVDPAYVYGKLVVYQCGDTMYVLDLDTGESRAVVSAEWIINYWIMDNKVFMISQEYSADYAMLPDKPLRLYYADVNDGVLVQLENGGNTESMEFSIYAEGDSFFIGHYNGGYRFIFKDDFYAERYENARYA